MSNEIHEGPERIAVIGMACRFPGAEDVDAFWRNLRGGVESISRITAEDLVEAGTDPALLERPDYVPAAGAIEGADLFDAEFFGFNPRDAELMDPQHRVFLEQAWAALEHAGVDPDSYPGPIGVFAGTNMNSYLFAMLARHGARGADALQNRIRSDKDFLATQASYKLNLRGPSMTVQTACSTSLVATHLACGSLLDLQCDVALAGGVSITVPLKDGYFARDGVFSPDGHCRAFDARGEGTVVASGVGVVVLKRLSDALADGDRIHATILGSAVNNDGSAKVGYTAPSVDGQIEVIAMAHAVADVDPETITYVEAHGTATPVGDPIEVTALTKAFNTDDRGFCALGSVKTNIGHTDAAAGVASLIKTVLALREGEIPPSLHFEAPNPRIDFARSPFFVADRLLPWEGRDGGPRRAGINSFGVGGTNAHLVLEEPPREEPRSAAAKPELLVLSARTPEALDALAASLAERLEREPELAAADVAFTLQRGRRAFRHRRALVASRADEAAALLRGGDPTRVVTQLAAGADPGVVFLFSGLGTQYAGMSRELYETEPAFRAAMDQCFRILRDAHGMDLRPVLFGAGAADARAGAGVDLRAMVRGGGGPSETDPLQGARWGHPAMFAVGFALAKLLRSRGIEPRAVVGHSLGEYVAACVAGVFTPEDAIALVVRRAELLERVTGSMAAVALPEDETRALVERLVGEGHGLWLAAVNAPRSCVVSGSAEAVAAFSRRAKEGGALVLPLAVRHPFHSGLLAPLREEFARIVGSIRRRAPEVPLASNVTGKWLRAEQAQSVEYWVEHLLSPVRFAECVDTARGMGAGDEPVLLEVGPGAVLGSWARQQGAQRIAASMRHGEQPGSDREVFLRALGQLWCFGVPVDWSLQGDETGRRRVVLPGHPLARKRFWLADGPRAESAAAEPRAPGAERRLPAEEWFWAPLWRQTPDADSAGAEAFAGHRVVVFGGAEAEPLAAALRAAGAEAARVEEGGAWADRGEVLAVRPASREDHDRLAEALRARGWHGPLHTLHLWSAEDPSAGVTPEAAARGMERGLYSVMHWVQAAGDAGFLAEGSTLAAATRGARAVLGTEELRPWDASLGAFLRVVPQEFPGTRCRSVDVDGGGAGWMESVLAEAALLLEGGGRTPEVAYRGPRRWEPFFEPLALREPRRAAPAALRERGVYLVTGGLGGIGLTLARHLAERVGARLVLTGRRGLPPREGWNAWLAEHGEADATSRRILAVREIEALGGEVLVAAADSADPAAMRAAVAQATERFGELHGVVHAAGVVPGGLIQLKSAERMAEVLAPKVAGTLALDEATAGLSLDWVLLCSSLHALYGGIGSADHCAANAFMDTFAEWRNRRGDRAVVSVAWDGWAEVGQAANLAVSRSLGELIQGPAGAPTAHPLLGSRTERGGGWDFVAELDATLWVLDEHRVGGTAVLPGTAYLEMARAAFADRFPGVEAQLEQVVFLAPLPVPDGAGRTVRLRLEPEGEALSFRVFSRPRGGDEAGEREHARGRVRAAEAEPAERLDLDALRASLAPQEVAGAAASPAAGVLGFGPRWTGSLRGAWRSGGELLAELRLADDFAGDVEGFALHPALLDVATGFLREQGGGFFLPLAYERVRVRGALPARFFSLVRQRDEGGSGETVACDVLLVDERGDELVRIEGYALRRVAGATVLTGGAAAEASDRPAAPRAVDGAPAGITPREGAEAFVRVLEQRFGPRVAVCTRDLPALVERALRFDRDQAAEVLRSREGARATHPRPDVATPYVAPRSELEQELAAMFQRALGVEPVGADDAFFEMGGDSLLATQLLGSINEAFRVELPLRALFEAPSPAQLALRIVQEQMEEVDDDLLAQALAEL